MQEPTTDTTMLRILADGPVWDRAGSPDELRLEGLARDGLAAYVRSGVLYGHPYRQYQITDAGRAALAAA